MKRNLEEFLLLFLDPAASHLDVLSFFEFRDTRARFISGNSLTPDAWLYIRNARFFSYGLLSAAEYKIMLERQRRVVSEEDLDRKVQLLRDRWTILKRVPISTLESYASCRSMAKLREITGRDQLSYALETAIPQPVITPVTVDDHIVGGYTPGFATLVMDVPLAMYDEIASLVRTTVATRQSEADAARRYAAALQMKREEEPDASKYGCLSIHLHLEWHKLVRWMAVMRQQPDE